MNYFQLIYTSHATVEVTDRLLLNILVKADKNNHTQDISGLLLYSQNRFIQLIEARQQKTVESLFAKISKDPRHSNIEVLLRRESNELLMPAWAMGFSMTSKEDSAITKFSFYIHMNEVTQICKTMPSSIGQCFCNFLGLN